MLLIFQDLICFYLTYLTRSLFEKAGGRWTTCRRPSNWRPAELRRSSAGAGEAVGKFCSTKKNRKKIEKEIQKQIEKINFICNLAEYELEQLE